MFESVLFSNYLHEHRVLAEYRRWARDEDNMHARGCGCPATMAGKPIARTPQKEALYG
jgi:hypothetical protein